MHILFVHTVPISLLGKRQPVPFHDAISQNDGQPFVVDHVLPLGGENASTLFEQSIATPVSVEVMQYALYPVVFPGEKRMHAHQAEVLIDTTVSWCKAGGNIVW